MAIYRVHVEEIWIKPTLVKAKSRKEAIEKILKNEIWAEKIIGDFDYDRMNLERKYEWQVEILSDFNSSLVS